MTTDLNPADAVREALPDPMRPAQRYDFNDPYYGAKIEESIDGEYVAYAEHFRIIVALNAKLAALTARVDEWAATALREQTARIDAVHKAEAHARDAALGRAALMEIAASRIPGTGVPAIPDLTADQAWRLANDTLSAMQEPQP